MFSSSTIHYRLNKASVYQKNEEQAIAWFKQTGPKYYTESYWDWCIYLI